MNFKLLLIVSISINVITSSSIGQETKVGSSIGSSDVVSITKEELRNVDGQKKEPSTQPEMHRGQPTSLASRVNQLEAEFREKMEEMKMQNSRSSKDQNEKIAILTVRERNLAKILNQTNEEVKELKTQNTEQSKRIDQLERKVILLQSTSALAKANSNDKINKGAAKSKDSPTFTKALSSPSSCQDLLKLGYHLDGLYLVKNERTKKIQTVLCQFIQGGHVNQQLIGNVDVKTKSVHFYVQRESTFVSNGASVPFQVERLNVGGAMDVARGIFTAPVAGIYHFEFSGLKDPSVAAYVAISLQVNGVTVGMANNQLSSSGTFDRVSLTASLRLKPNDRVFLFPGGGALFDNQGHHNHFTGWLVEEDLM